MNNWVNDDTKTFIDSLTFDCYILAGNSVSNMIEHIPLQGDLDFWVMETNKYMNAFDEMCKYYNNFNLYPSMVEMYNDDNILPKINLILTNQTNYNIINNFDFDYCKCFWTPINGIFKTDDCLKCIKTKKIHCNTYVKEKRLYKAVKYGYKFPIEFWSSRTDLLLNKNKINKGVKYCDITIDDLDPSKFNRELYKMEITNKYYINATIHELATQYHSIQSTETILPILLTFNKSEIPLLKQYITAIIYNNPLTDSKYDDVVFKKHTKKIIDKRETGSDDEVVFKKNTKKIIDECETESDYEEPCTPNTMNDESDDEVPCPKAKSCSNVKSCSKANSCSNVKSCSKTKSCSGMMVKSIHNNVIDTVYGQKRVVQLNQSGSSYIIIEFLNETFLDYTKLFFNDMWNLHPIEKHKIIMYEKEVTVNRFSKSYMNTYTDLSHTINSSYMYSGYDTSTNNDELPNYFMMYYNFMKKKDNNYNQVIANWYDENNDYISQHADCQRGMINNYVISMLSLYQNNENYTYLQIKSKKQYNDSLYEELNIQMSNCSIITMCGDMQNNYTHGISTNTNKRIGLSFRQMT